MQNGYIYRAYGAWHLRYRRDGKQVSCKLADFNDQYRTKRSVRQLAEDILIPLNQGLEVNGLVTLQQYAESIYFPAIKTKKSPSTYKGYFNLYSKHIKPRIGGLKLSTCQTKDIQRILYKIDEEEELSHQSFLNINCVLSAIFTHARRSGSLTGPNPTDDVEIPEGKRTKKTPKYTLDQVEKMTVAGGSVSDLARCAVVLAAWTGLSLAELRGLKWEDINCDQSLLNVKRTVWHRHTLETKTEHRADTVHLLPNVVTELQKLRKLNPTTVWVFEGPLMFPIDLATLGSKRIKEALKGTGAEWHGFHAFRRGLGTRLFNNGTPIETVGKILRHGSGSEVTMKHYVDIEDSTKATALQNLPMVSK